MELQRPGSSPPEVAGTRSDPPAKLAAWRASWHGHVFARDTFGDWPTGAAIAGILLALLAVLQVAESATQRGVAVGAFTVMAILVAGILLSRRLLLLLLTAAIGLRVAAVVMGGVPLATAIEQTTAYLVTAGLIWLATESMRTAQSNAAQAERARKVLQTGVDLARASSSPGDWVSRLNQFSIEAVGADGGHISRLEGDEMVVQASFDHIAPSLPVGSRWKLADQPMAAELMTTKRPVQGVPAVPSGLDPKIASTVRRVRHYLVIPLVYEDAVHGVISLARFHEPAFSEAEMEAVEQVASMASLALLSADLYRNLNTARLEAEATTSRLEKRERQLEDAQGMAHLGNYDFDLERNQSTWSPETYRVFGLDPSAGAPSFPAYLQMVHPDDREKVERAIERARLGKPLDIEYRITRPDGRQRTLQSRARLVTDEAGRPVMLAGTIQDITELKRAEQRLIELTREREQELRNHAQRMEALEKVKTEFLLLASHELRGPLGVLNGYLSLMEAGVLGDLPEKVGEILPMLSAQGAAMKRLIDEMLETARLEQTIDIELEPVDLRDAVWDAVRTAGRLRDAEDRVRVDLPADAVPVRADRDRLTMVIQALLDNAIKFSAPGRAVTCRIGVEGDSAVVVVRDRGQGIRAEDVPKLFTRFGRIVTAENAHISGTGLGLYLAQRFANMHGGRITVESEPGRGSAFTLRMPMAGDLRFGSDGRSGLEEKRSESLMA